MKSIMMEAADAATCAAAEKEFNAELQPFCKLLHLQPAHLGMQTPTLLFLVNMRLFKLLTSKIKEFDTRLSALEPRQ